MKISRRCTASLSLLGYTTSNQITNIWIPYKQDCIAMTEIRGNLQISIFSSTIYTKMDDFTNELIADFSYYEILENFMEKIMNNDYEHDGLMGYHKAYILDVLKEAIEE